MSKFSKVSTTITPEVMGKCNKMSRAQRVSLDAFLNSPQGFKWRIPLEDELVRQMAMLSWSRCGDAGRAADDAFCLAWDEWVSTLEVRPPASHAWSKGACVLILGY
jgi:hypothetical protein